MNRCRPEKKATEVDGNMFKNNPQTPRRKGARQETQKDGTSKGEKEESQGEKRLRGNLQSSASASVSTTLEPGPGPSLAPIHEENRNNEQDKEEQDATVPHPWGPRTSGYSARNPHPKSPCVGEERRAGLGQTFPAGSPNRGVQEESCTKR